ncbi:hypothetical protein [Klebsiella pneumoniae]|uniref:hypothetical protein n=1 Tax=Klebsiella pneumoniae TaxID=573 RepID=UPI003B58824C
MSNLVNIVSADFLWTGLHRVCVGNGPVDIAAIVPRWLCCNLFFARISHRLTTWLF